MSGVNELQWYLACPLCDIHRLLVLIVIWFCPFLQFAISTNRQTERKRETSNPLFTTQSWSQSCPLLKSAPFIQPSSTSVLDLQTVASGRCRRQWNRAKNGVHSAEGATSGDGGHLRPYSPPPGAHQWGCWRWLLFLLLQQCWRRWRWSAAFQASSANVRGEQHCALWPAVLLLHRRQSRPSHWHQVLGQSAAQVLLRSLSHCWGL